MTNLMKQLLKWISTHVILGYANLSVTAAEDPRVVLLYLLAHC